VTSSDRARIATGREARSPFSVSLWRDERKARLDSPIQGRRGGGRATGRGGVLINLRRDYHKSATNRCANADSLIAGS